ncbi:RimK/LysX family protein [Rubritalea spongiae]|uniref:RimK/LysX family protein n=1 Tax=Rubritalea spongiae TaxID=430797 RepID=A0ABW5E166_9BACT
MNKELLAFLCVVTLPMCSVPVAIDGEDYVPERVLVATKKKLAKAEAKNALIKAESQKKIEEIETQKALAELEARRELEAAEMQRKLVEEEAARRVAEAQAQIKLIEERSVPQPESSLTQSDLRVLGEVEPIGVLDVDWYYSARIDTGATTSSIHAEKIEPFERDGVQWVRFELVNEESGKKEKLERKIERKVRIKEHDDDSERRYVVKLHVYYGGENELLEFTLTDRSGYKYPLLVGRNLLRGIAVVDVSKKNTLKKEKLEDKE